MNRDRFQIFFPDETTKEKERPLTLIERAKEFVSNPAFNLRNTSGESESGEGLESEWRIRKEDAPLKIATLLISYLLFTGISTFYNEAYVTAKSAPPTT